MATVKATPRSQVGSKSWIAEERDAALRIAEAEAEEFAFSARNEVDWLNEHMAEIFTRNEVNVAEIFKTPGKLRGKTPRTARKVNLEARVPLSDVFSATPRGAPSPYTHTQASRPVSTFRVAEDEPKPLIQQGTDSTTQHSTLDSGYFGSQFTANLSTQPNGVPQPVSPVKLLVGGSGDDAMDLDAETEEDKVERRMLHVEGRPEEEIIELYTLKDEPVSKRDEIPESQVGDQSKSPVKLSPHQVTNPARSPRFVTETHLESEPTPVIGEADEEQSPQSASEGSSPIRPILRKSSLNFASLPAREPLTTKKSIGNRVSHVSQLEHNRTSHYGKRPGGKSLGNKQDDVENDSEDIHVDEHEMPVAVREDSDSKIRFHNKTSTQRLQDQISMLGQSQSAARPPTKTSQNAATLPQPPIQATKPAEPSRVASPRKDRSMIAPGAFPADEDDSWIGPPTALEKPSIFSPRPQLNKSYSAEVMNGIRYDSISGSQFNIPKRGDDERQRSPLRGCPAPENAMISGHAKSASTSIVQSPKKSTSPNLPKTISVSNPNPTLEPNDQIDNPPKSPSRSFKGSPLKAAKDKFSSILKTSKGLFASSAAVSAEAKSSAIVPSRLVRDHARDAEIQSAASSDPLLDGQAKARLLSQSPDRRPKSSARETRASTERKERQREAEGKADRDPEEVHKPHEKLDNARMKVEEEARIYKLEQERVAAMQQEIQDRKEQEKQAKTKENGPLQPTRTSPRKTKAQLEAEGVAAAALGEQETKDVEMQDASIMPPPAFIRPKSQIGRPSVKRPLKPAKEAVNKVKPPTVIRVDTGSQRGHQYHPSNTTLSTNLQESLAPPMGPAQGALKHKASNSSISSKASTNNFKSTASRALEAAARKKEQDELAAQRKKDAKLEVERQRAAAKEEERRQQEAQRRRDQERQRELQREREQAASVADAKKTAARQAMEKRKLELEKAKQTGAPPPAIRHLDGPAAEKALPPVPREPAQTKPARLASIIRQEDSARPTTIMLHNTTKMPPKRPLPQDGDEHHARTTVQINPASYQHNEAHTKRRKTSDNFGADDTNDGHPKMTAPPIRQSGIRPKDAPTKSLFPSGYTTVPQAASLQRTTLLSQHNMNQPKPLHPMDMAQVSKAPISFGAASQAPVPSHKTPARLGGPPPSKSAKSTGKSSPRYQNGDAIDLPEIPTDSEDEDSDGGKNDFVALGWTNSPDLRRALAVQETIDPAQVFGQPAPLNMEEVFNKSKDRFKKFRDRTSSANWSGVDGLTDEEVRKDLEARDRVRRQGGWSYDSMI